ncbi:hypothetical protein M153_3193000396 [Pseudoloma neurophilia]|uniref:Uncharacterized protein n=1 Tax=Pseudoloma neurophilia TaxID=146866 RepID=A0A0R0LTV7_9MICR|nr:hypothetical protein M153_3193000396 [Pseudoloma neurophilia]
MKEHQSWKEFLKIAEESSWLSFANNTEISNSPLNETTKIEQVVSKSRRLWGGRTDKQNSDFKNFKAAPRVFCTFHGLCGHSTSRCRSIDIIRNRRSENRFNNQNRINKIEDSSHTKSDCQCNKNQF